MSRAAAGRSLRFCLPILSVLLLSLVLPREVRSDSDRAVPTGALVVDVSNLQNLGKGQLVGLVFEKMKRVEVKGSPFLRREILEVSGKEVTFRFEALPHGEYAVAIFHDMDRDLVADTNLIGIPREDLAVSNNAKGGPLGGPRWEAAKFTHQGDVTRLAVSIWRCYR